MVEKNVEKGIFEKWLVGTRFKETRATLEEKKKSEETLEKTKK
jgi:hypothetical protein